MPEWVTAGSNYRHELPSMFVRILACAFSTLGVEQLIQYDSNLDLVPQLA